MNLGLTGRACIVSGGSRGIGLEVARQLHGEGADLLLLGRGPAALRAFAMLRSGVRMIGTLHAESVEAVKDFAAQRIIAYPADHRTAAAQRVGVIRKIRRRSAQPGAAGQQIP